MKRILNILIMFAALLMIGCKQEVIVFDHEQQQFEVRSNAILIELIVPTGTAADDEIYIYGAFNGADENTVIDMLEWKMEKAQLSDKKWGIYLFPDNFVVGKTLADGFSFVSLKSGAERDINGEPVSHTLDADVGTRNNIWVDRWAAYFSGGGETVKHNGYVVYVLDESGFADLNMYMYGDVNDLNGGWPGMKPIGTETINGVEYTYFDLGSDNNGLNETLIFSDGGSNQLSDYGPITINDNYFLHITSDGTIEAISSSSTVSHDGATVYILDGIGWGMNTTLYMWGDVNDLNGGWPGMTVKGTAKFGAYTYMYFDLGVANNGLTEHLIFSNNGATQLPDYDDYVIGEDIFLYLAANTVTVISDPEHPGDVEWFDPEAKPKEAATIDLYFYNGAEKLISGISENEEPVEFILNVYAWGSSEVFGAWPGLSFGTMDELSILGLPLKHTEIQCFIGDEFHIIINNGNGEQLDDYNITADNPANEYYLKITDDSVSPLSVVAQKHQTK